MSAVSLTAWRVDAQLVKISPITDPLLHSVQLWQNHTFHQRVNMLTHGPLSTSMAQ